MKPIVKTSIIGTIAAIIVALVISMSASQGSVMAYGAPLFAICAVLAFLIQWTLFIPSYLFKTEHFYDLAGGLTYVTVLVVAVIGAGSLDERGIVIAVLCGVWALRLSSFLFLRVRAAGFDRRFNKMLSIPMQLFMTWTLQGLWVTVTLSAGLAAITSTNKVAIDAFVYLGSVMWLLGFVIEVVADKQKSNFRAKDQGGFITGGLWSWSRHPNYFGEILLWAGIAVIALPTLQGWQWVTMISPIFVYILLTRISGVHMLEISGGRRWGEDPQYQRYLRNTSELMMWPPKQD